MDQTRMNIRSTKQHPVIIEPDDTEDEDPTQEPNSATTHQLFATIEKIETNG
jgi:hypothetical protein